MIVQPNDSVTPRHAEISVKGQAFCVPRIQIGNRAVVVTGTFLKTATIQDEELVEGELVDNPRSFASSLNDHKPRADIFAFSQNVTDRNPKYTYRFEWDNAAVVSTARFADWWEKLPQEARKNARRAQKRGVSLQLAEFKEEFVRGIKAIYDETPVRQGRPFWHFSKALERVKTENATYLERSDFIGAYYQGELIGFIKLVYVDSVANIVQILSKNAHYDKRPTNALLARAVELCAEKGILYLVYGKYSYGKKTGSQLTEFKRRNGFEEVRFPRYYVPLTWKGKLALGLNLHRSLIEILPPSLISFLLKVRATIYGRRRTPREGTPEKRVSDTSQALL